MTFSRVSGNPNEVLPNAVLTDRALDDQGYLWWCGGSSWSIDTADHDAQSKVDRRSRRADLGAGIRR